MTYEKLERANELSDTLNNLLDIQNIFCAHARMIGDDELDFVSISRVGYRTVNIPVDICDKIMSLIAEERKKTQKEFDEL